MIVAGEAAGGMDFRERELDCPACGSADTKLFVHPDSDDVVQVDGMYLATCKTCDHVFSLDQRGAELLSAALPVGTTIHIATLCPNCDYNLKTLRIGDACPECGEVIPRLVQRINAEKGVGMRGRTIASAVFLLAVATFFVAGPALFPNSDGEQLLLAFAAYLLTICGMNIREYWAVNRKEVAGVEHMIDFPASSVFVILVVLALVASRIAGFL